MNGALKPRVKGTDDEPIGFVSTTANGGWAYALTRTGRPVGVAPDAKTAALALRDFAEAVS